MRILLIEDEIPAFEKLRLLLSTLLDSDTVYDWARSVEEAIALLEAEEEYQLIFSDIQLLDGLSFEIFEKVSLSIPIIFCSAYDAYLLSAFQSNGIAYILKPYGIKEVAGALEKYEKLFPVQKSNILEQDVWEQLKESVRQSNRTYKERFVIKGRKGIQLVATSDIALIEASGDFCKLVDASAATHLYSESLGKIYAQLNPAHFFRINRSQVVQLQHIETIENHFKNRLVLSLAGMSKTVMTSSNTTAHFRIWLDQ